MTAGLSGAALAILGIVTVHGESEYHLNAQQMQDELQLLATQSLVDAGQDWATVEMTGQRALISGAPPSVEAAEAAKNAVLTSAGQGGMLWGGVWSVATDFEEIRDLPTASPFVWRAIKSSSGAMVFVGAVPDETSKAALAEHAATLSADSL
eukprot:CAMPEP_0184459458 /NCGR_PEP_ID=MMETSP0740-20130409/36961_1 /TAXON_ID=385413 /ORGANISM="Thalassiosira miniscula, Strain CCMP1093" /LENGTH=151 /DNA_ID=CAMNT_0026832459 /DNA_START=93 /DNA_END=544 /DNA_ORIENTATION=+